jgi:hypothetical protein
MPFVADTPSFSGETYLIAPDNLVFNIGIDSLSSQLHVLLSGLGGYREDGQRAISVGLALIDLQTGQSISSTSVTFRRWQDHFLLVPDVAIVTFFPDAIPINPGGYTIILTPVYEGPNDYCWLGPLIVMNRKGIP